MVYRGGGDLSVRNNPSLPGRGSAGAEMLQYRDVS